MSQDLETYVLLAKQATGPALASLILQAIESPSIFSFTSLLTTPSVQALQDGEFSGTKRLLEIFSYGTMQDYISENATLPKFNPAALVKLVQLTIISRANESHVHPLFTSL